jgi:hypothetical protein
MWVTGKDRTFKTLKREGHYNADVAHNDLDIDCKKNIVSLKQKVYNYLLDNYLNVPDRFWTWESGAIKKGNKLVKKHNIKFVYTTSLPFTTFKIGSALKKNNDIKWIADYRDPIMYSLKNHSSISHVFKKQKQIDLNALEEADVITCTSSAYKLIYHDLYGGKYDHKMYFIPTGVDNDYLPTERLDSSNEILYR